MKRGDRVAVVGTVRAVSKAGGWTQVTMKRRHGTDIGVQVTNDQLVRPIAEGVEAVRKMLAEASEHMLARDPDDVTGKGYATVATLLQRVLDGEEDE